MILAAIVAGIALNVLTLRGDRVRDVTSIAILVVKKLA